MSNADFAPRADRAIEANSQFHPTAYFAALAVLAALLLFPSLHRPGLAGYDDAFFSHEAKEMVRTGDWWNVRLNGDILFEIPPMFVWLQAGSFELFGMSDTTAKLPTAVLGFSTILLLYFLTLELTGRPWLSLFAMLVLASTQFFLKNATHAMTDVPFAFFFTLTIFFYVKGLRSPQYFAWLGIPLGLALLTRSVVGFLALGVVLAHLVLTKRYAMLLSPWLIAGIAIALALASVWYLSQYRQHGAAYFAGHLKFLGGKMHAETGANGWTTIFNYPIALLKYYWPWLPFLIAGLVMEARAWAKERDQVAILLIVWVVLILIPFSLIETRYPRYIMAVFPSFSIVSAIALNRVIFVRNRKIFFNAACVIGCLAVCASLLLAPRNRADEIIKLAPIAEANTPPDQRVLFYTYEDGREDYLFQFIWYCNRYARLAANLDDLAATLLRSERSTVITDRASYEKLRLLIQGKVPVVLGESRNLVCFRVP